MKKILVYQIDSLPQKNSNEISPVAIFKSTLSL
jgi:hypothetical protein